ncbi:MAG TPA: glycoside hydrolase family 15 protein [Mycobacterium sp.]
MAEPAESAAMFPPHVLREYSLLADGERGALAGPQGDYAWLCFPRWDSPAVFSALLGGAGGYSVSPVAPRYVWGGYYEERSLIWRSRWVTTTGVIECREALAFPGDPHTAVLLRRVLAVDGDAEVRARLAVRADFGTHPMTVEGASDGRLTATSGPVRLRWNPDSDIHIQEDGIAEAVVKVREGAFHDMTLELSDAPIPRQPIDPAARWDATERAWRETVPAFDGSLADNDARHAYAVLRGLTSHGGGMVAAATTSLPERADRGTNYDYRYAWIRDQCYAGEAVAVSGECELLDAAVDFVGERILADGPQLKPAYIVTGGRVPDEKKLPLPGYPGAKVRTGNWVNQQFQLDAFGEALLLFANAGQLDRLDRQRWQAIETAVDAIRARWTEADAGIWELDDARWAHSRLICAAGLRAVAPFAPAAKAADWADFADAIVEDTTGDCLHPSGRWQRASNDTRVDAALLLPAIRGAVPFADPRSVATLDAVRAELCEQHYLYRFRHDERPLGEAEGAFLLCGFLMALAENQQGNAVDAARWFERNRAGCGPPGLFTEEFDVDQRQLRGNFPQAFVHALMFEAAHRLAGYPR